MFDFTEMQTVLYLNFIAYEGRDLMVMAWQETPLSRPQARFRIRTYHPDSTDPWDAKDPKAWYDIGLKPGAQSDLVADLQSWIAQIRETWDEPTRLVDEFIGPASAREVSTWLRSRAWVHGKVLNPDDPDDARWLQQRRAARRQRRRR